MADCLLDGGQARQTVARPHGIWVQDHMLRMGGPSMSRPPSTCSKRGVPGSSAICEECGADARFVEWREKTFVVLFGPVKVCSPCYHCHSGCGTGLRSRDAMPRLGTQPLTPAAEETSAMAGLLGSFADGAERVLRKMSGLRLSESTVARTTQTAGERVTA